MSHAVVIGGSSGIGLAAAQHAKAQGCRVTVLSRNAERAPVEADKISVDISDTQRLKACLEAIGPYEYLVCTAPFHLNGPFRELDLAAARRAFDVKFWGPLEAIQASDVREGIVLVTGVSAAVPWRDGQSTIASAVCGAMEAAVRALALGLAPVRVNAVSPGTIKTNLFAAMPVAEVDAMYAHYSEVLPTGRIGEPSEVAESIWMLLTNPFITGEVLFVDGGHRLVAP